MSFGGMFGSSGGSTLSRLEKAKCKKVFDQLDFDGSGELDEPDLRAGLKAMGLTLDPAMINAMIEEVACLF